MHLKTTANNPPHRICPHRGKTKHTPTHQEPKVAVFMPVLNEEKTIANNLLAIKKSLEYGLINQLVLVLDGCTDDSAKIAFEILNLSSEQKQRVQSNKAAYIDFSSGSRVLVASHEKPKGKGLSFARSVWSLDEENFFADESAVVVTIDSDVLNLLPTTPYRLADQLLARKEKMMLGMQMELTTPNLKKPRISKKITPPRFNGFRAILGTELKPLINKDPRWMKRFPTGICMEEALNHLIYPERKKIILGESFFNIPSTEKPCLLAGTTGKNVSGDKQADLATNIDLAFSSKNLSVTTLYTTLADC